VTRIALASPERVLWNRDCVAFSPCGLVLLTEVRAGSEPGRAGTRRDVWLMNPVCRLRVKRRSRFPCPCAELDKNAGLSF